MSRKIATVNQAALEAKKASDASSSNVFNPALPAGFKVKPRPPARTSTEEMSFEVVDVTPTMAEEWLKSNSDDQRRLRQGVVEAYALEMTKGQWKLTHQPIAFNEAGVLIDGQHRLSAIILSKTTQRFVVASAPGMTVHDPIDRGVKRSLGDLLGWHNSLVAAANMVYKLMTADFSGKRASKDDLLLAYEYSKQDFDACVKLYDRKVMMGPVLGAIIFARPINPEMVSEFMIRLKSGSELKSDDPSLTLRNWLLTSAQRKGNDPFLIAFAASNALSAFLQGRPLQKMFAGPTGYRWFCQKRRGLGIENTPDAKVIPSDSQHSPNAVVFPARFGKKYRKDSEG